MKKLIALIALLQCLAVAGLAADKQTFNVADFGAKGDGVTKDTTAIQKALDACDKEGGGAVLVPGGVYLTGSLVLHANTTLQLASRANLLGHRLRGIQAPHRHDRGRGRALRRHQRPH